MHTDVDICIVEVTTLTIMHCNCMHLANPNSYASEYISKSEKVTPVTLIAAY